MFIFKSKGVKIDKTGGLVIMSEEFTEYLSTGGQLHVSKDRWYLRYYFGGPDLRYKGYSIEIDSHEIDKYINAWRNNYTKYCQLITAIPTDGNYNETGECGMSIQIGGYCSGVCLRYNHMNINTQEGLEKVIADYEYAKKKAAKLQLFFEEGGHKPFSDQETNPNSEKDFKQSYLIENEENNKETKTLEISNEKKRNENRRTQRRLAREEKRKLEIKEFEERKAREELEAEEAKRMEHRNKIIAFVGATIITILLIYFFGLIPVAILGLISAGIIKLK